MDVVRQPVEYCDPLDKTVLEGMLCYPRSMDVSGVAKYPCVLVCHAFQGRTPFEVKKAVSLAELGYVSFAIDVYGKGQIAADATEGRKMMAPFNEDREGLLRRRLRTAVDTVKALPYVDHAKIGAIGFCFGGVCILDMARANFELAGVVSFHGVLSKDPKWTGDGNIATKVLVLHGFDDPLAPAAQFRFSAACIRSVTDSTLDTEVVDFMNEMTSRSADWQVHAYGKAAHAFTKPDASKLGLPGIAYDENADKRSWLAMKNFFHEIFDNAASKL